MNAPTGEAWSPVEVCAAAARAPLLIIADHGGRGVPPALVSADGPLGLPTRAFERHIAWDIGAAGVARGLSARLGATAVLAAYSRLLIDPNRPLGDPECVPATSDGIPIPANADLDQEALDERARRYYWPYHTTIDEHLGRLQRSGAVPMLVSIHSFTPALLTAGSARPWHVGVMASRDTRLSDALLQALGERPGLHVAFNQPYSGITHGYCLKVHGLAQGIPHAQIEIRQDLICTPAGEAWWADLLSQVLVPIVASERFHRLAHF